MYLGHHIKMPTLKSIIESIFYLIEAKMEQNKSKIKTNIQLVSKNERRIINKGEENQYGLIKI